MIKIAHRGASGYAPENTLLSFKKALELSADMIECDVFSLPNETIIIHDYNLHRTTNGNGYVMEKSLHEIRQLDAGKGEKIPTLQEVLDTIDRKVITNIELKGANTATPVAEIIEDYIQRKGWTYDDFLVSSFNQHELKKIKTLLPQIKIGVLLSGIPLDYAKIAQDLRAYSINLDREYLNKEFINDAHERGLKVFVFTVNDSEDMKRFEKLGVDGIFTDYLDLL